MSGYNLQTSIPLLERSLALFRPHHLELRQRVIKVMLAVLLASVVAYLFIEKIAAFCIAPLFAASPLVYRLVYTNLPEAFVAYLKLAFLVGVIGAMPVAIYQLWMFVAPGLKKSEKRLALVVVFWAMLLFSGGAVFAFFVVLPKMLVYFMSYASDHLEPLPKLGLYLTFVARTILTFGIAFQIPFLMVMSGKAGFITAATFRKRRTPFYVAIVVLSFLLTAGDPVATVLLAIPLFLLYEAGIFLTGLFSGKKSSAT